jgi:hypothetical protein
VAIKKLARSFVRLAYFVVLFYCTGHGLPSPECYIDYEMARKLALIINDNENADSIYDAYSHIDLFIMLTISTLFYIVTMKLIRRLRST